MNWVAPQEQIRACVGTRTSDRSPDNPFRIRHAQFAGDQFGQQCVANGGESSGFFLAVVAAIHQGNKKEVLIKS